VDTVSKTGREAVPAKYQYPRNVFNLLILT
jgi:hypothetical protein